MAQYFGEHPNFRDFVDSGEAKDVVRAISRARLQMRRGHKDPGLGVVDDEVRAEGGGEQRYAPDREQGSSDRRRTADNAVDAVDTHVADCPEKRWSSMRSGSGNWQTLGLHARKGFQRRSRDDAVLTDYRVAIFTIFGTMGEDLMHMDDSCVGETLTYMERTMMSPLLLESEFYNRILGVMEGRWEIKMAGSADAAQLPSGGVGAGSAEGCGFTLAISAVTRRIKDYGLGTVRRAVAKHAEQGGLGRNNRVGGQAGGVEEGSTCIVDNGATHVAAEAHGAAAGRDNLGAFGRGADLGCDADAAVMDVQTSLEQFT